MRKKSDHSTLLLICFFTLILIIGIVCWRVRSSESYSMYDDILKFSIWFGKFIDPTVGGPTDPFVLLVQNSEVKMYHLWFDNVWGGTGQMIIDGDQATLKFPDASYMDTSYKIANAGQNLLTTKLACVQNFQRVNLFFQPKDIKVFIQRVFQTSGHPYPVQEELATADSPLKIGICHDNLKRCFEKNYPFGEEFEGVENMDDFVTKERAKGNTVNYLETPHGFNYNIRKY